MALGVMAVLAAGARADIDILDIWDNGSVPAAGFVFPNWMQVKAGSFDVWLCMDCGAGAENIKGMTVVNFGNALPADIKAVYWKARCGATASGLYTMSYAGTYAEDSGPHPAWTWAGTSIDVSGCADLCGTPACGAFFTIDIYVDVAACPTNLATINMGFPVNSVTNTTWWGSISDNYGYILPWGDNAGSLSTIVYAYKEGDKDAAAPGDTVTYTVYYGRPGATDLTKVEVMDTQPPYTHYVPGSGDPAPDTFWDPNPGPPAKLKWTIPPPHPVSGGPTDSLVFSLTVDWGNGETFEAGSGNVGAPEGYRLDNRAHVFFWGTTCGLKSVVTPPVTAVVRRFLFWKLGDNDVLFSPTYGQSPDEMIYTIFFKNTSDQKTWWDVHVWDSVPPELNPWDVDCGFEDPCTGWTMTPSGCAPASPGWLMSSGLMLLTWKLDMPPDMTLQLRWKAKVNATTVAGTTAINRASLLEYGHSRIVDGTGASGPPKNFSHLAPIVLPTTYTSYVGYAAGDQQDGCPGFLIPLFPLNRKAQCELRAIQYAGAGWASNGGVSQSIGCMVGDCLGGFPGNGGCNLGNGVTAIPGGGIPGCKTERIPAAYDPDNWQGTCPTLPFHFIFKLTANSPLAWQMLSRIAVDNDDRQTYAPSSTLTFTGLLHYAWRLHSASTGAGWGDSLGLINTGANPDGVYDPDRTTTVHLFKFNYGTLGWDYMRTYEIAGESFAYDQGTNVANEGPWRTVSSDCQLIVCHGFNQSDTLGNKAFIANNYSAYMPTRETGNEVSMVGSGNFYGIVQTGNSYAGDLNRVVIGNTGATKASYEVWRYQPDNILAKAPMPVMLNGTSGTWVLMGPDTVGPGFPVPADPNIYSIDGPLFTTPSTGLFKVILKSGGPIQVLAGSDAAQWGAGGQVIHAADGNQSGFEFWYHDTFSDNGKANPPYSTLDVDLFCSKTGMAIRGQSTDGYSATYTTGGPDQCVSFMRISVPASGSKRNYRFTVLPGPNQGRAICMKIQDLVTQKGYTAPFLQMGVHYAIILPPVVYLGQSFWITVVVLETGGGTKTDYAGTTSFTSTDPGAKIQSGGMDSYNYVWGGCGTDCGVKIFFNVSFSRIGTQTVVAQDTLDGSITGLASTLVVAVDVKLEKRKKLSIAASGDMVQFQICWSNFSSATAFSFTITDAVPMGTTYVPEVASAMLCGSSAPVPGVTVWYSTATTTTPPGTFTSVPGTGSPMANTRWLRWTIRDVYVNSTGCVCFKVSVN